MYIFTVYNINTYDFNEVQIYNKKEWLELVFSAEFIRNWI